ncbi:Polyisoprenoid-binding protein YceI [Paenibacillus sp. UNCCL117]|uniref:YceI family protein n=1 Tax=unclassified Paenibacillus TaxID=185978 RepID=UPI00088A1670|nr:MULTISPECIES: YceI family protein [unclassified Paenibacillus]SDD18974.1 Polyisoprenoid-binding protein YceI [Paenibacillus sp. cl123]SFW35371.1 Polyisoprenoid-binding protein YceI [Paenibacillus sp. UNCCL117]
MKTNKLVIAAGSLVILLAGGYWAYDYYAGNHVEVKDVISSSAAAPGAGAAGSSGQAVQAGSIDGLWKIAPASEVYFSVTTSKETVNFVVTPVQGSWQLNTSSPAKSTAEGKLALSTLSSGNGQRDNHVKSADYLNIAQYPEATFKAKSFGELPKEWKEGVKVPVDLTGTLQVKDKTKDVVFKSEAVYEQGQLKLQGATTVTFSDFGMKNPHTVTLDTQNELQVQLRLVLERG